MAFKSCTSGRGWATVISVRKNGIVNTAAMAIKTVESFDNSFFGIGLLPCEHEAPTMNGRARVSTAKLSFTLDRHISFVT